MLIRSQDKKNLIPIMPIGITEIVRSSRGEINKVDGYAIYSYDNANTILGNYSTEEKAIKVLDMIEDAYNKCFAFSMGNDGYYHEARESKVFQMPQDSEV